MEIPRKKMKHKLQSEKANEEHCGYLPSLNIYDHSISKAPGAVSYLPVAPHTLSHFFHIRCCNLVKSQSVSNSPDSSP
jgi:hypothetical protein